jgi:hypothetical protein
LAAICGNPNNLINGFVGNFPLAAGASYNPNPGAAPIDFFDARGNTYNQGFFQLLRRNTEGGPRISDLRHQAWRGVLGMRGELSNVFSYDSYFQYGRTNYTQVYKNEFSTARLLRALNAVNVDASGTVVPVGTPGSSIVCRSVLDNSDPTCVPYDPFGAAPSAAARRGATPGFGPRPKRINATRACSPGERLTFGLNFARITTNPQRYNF